MEGKKGFHLSYVVHIYSYYRFIVEFLTFNSIMVELFVVQTLVKLSCMILPMVLIPNFFFNHHIIMP
jgi:hypothetical protein